MLLAIVPGGFAAVAISFAAAEARGAGATARRRARLELGALRGTGIARPLVPIACFELGNCATTLLILRATHLLQHGDRSLTAATSVAVLIYAAHNLFGAGVAYIGGHWIDRVGPRAAFAAGALLFALAYLGFAFPLHAWPLLLLAFVLAGSGIGLAETAESTLFAQAVPEQLRGSGFGLLGAVQSGGALASSAAVGLLWSAFSPSVAFVYAAGWMGLSLVGSGWLRVSDGRDRG
jgi:MFS family permease